MLTNGFVAGTNTIDFVVTKRFFSKKLFHDRSWSALEPASAGRGVPTAPRQAEGSPPCRNRLLFKALLVLAWLVAGTRIASALDNGVDPYHLGKGDWLWVMSSCQANIGVSTVQGVIDFEKSKGMQFLVVKCADGGQVWSQFNRDLVTRCHAAGMKVFGFQYVYGSYYGSGQVAAEINAAATSMAITDYSGVPMDGLMIDAEYEYNGRPNDAITYCQGLRAQFPTRFLAHSPYPIPSYNVSFPYIEFGKYCDAVFPQDYWYDQFAGSGGVTPEKMLSDMNNDFIKWQNTWIANGHADSVKPLAPIGQAFQGYSPVPIPGSEITRFFNAVKSANPCATAGGYQAISFWSCQHHTADEWNAIGAITIGTPPVITNQPVSLIRTQGDNASFSVVAGPAPLSCQWRKNGANLANGGNVSGATTPTLGLSNITTNDAAGYSVVLTNNFGALTSAVATLTVLVPPSIVTQPQSQSIIQGSGGATFSVAAAGTLPLTYQWQSSSRLYPPGTNNTSFTTTKPDNYCCIVSNAAGVVTSAVATLTVYVPPGILTQPESQTNLAGGSVTFSLTASGTPPLTYQWQSETRSYAPGTNNSSFATSKAGSYWCVVTNFAGAITSAVATAVFTNPPAQPSQFEGIRLLADGSVQLDMSGTANTNYVLECTSNWVDWADVITLTGSNGLFQYNDPAPTSGGQRFYRLRIGP